MRSNIPAGPTDGWNLFSFFVAKQFLAEKAKAEHVAPRWIGGDQSNLTEFGEKYGDLPDNVLQLDAVIEDLTEDLSGSIHNPQVIKKYEKVC